MRVILGAFFVILYFCENECRCEERRNFILRGFLEEFKEFKIF